MRNKIEEITRVRRISWIRLISRVSVISSRLLPVSMLGSCSWLRLRFPLLSLSSWWLSLLGPSLLFSFSPWLSYLFTLSLSMLMVMLRPYILASSHWLYLFSFLFKKERLSSNVITMISNSMVFSFRYLRHLSFLSNRLFHDVWLFFFNFNDSVVCTWCSCSFLFFFFEVNSISYMLGRMHFVILILGWNLLYF